MCHYRFYIFMGCGHSTSSSMPVNYCKNAVKLGKDCKKEARLSAESLVESENADNEVAGGLAIAEQPEVREIAQDEQFAQVIEDTNETSEDLARKPEEPDEPVVESDNATSEVAVELDIAEQPEVTVNAQDEQLEDKQPGQDEQPVQDEKFVQPIEDTDITPKKPTRKRKSGPKKTEMQPCKDGRVHPLHTVKLERMICADCVNARDQRLHAIESNSAEIRIEPSRWQWKYHGQSGGRPLSTTYAEVDKSPALGGNAAGHNKVDSGVWSIGAMMKGLEELHVGIVDRLN
jgi:hypothetical protein